MQIVDKEGRDLKCQRRSSVWERRSVFGNIVLLCMMATDSMNMEEIKNEIKKEAGPEDEDAWLYGDDTAGDDHAVDSGDQTTDVDATFDPSEEDYVPEEQDNVFDKEGVAKDVAGEGDEEEEDEDEDDDDEDDVQVTINMDSISTQMTPQFPFGAAAPVNINIAKRTPGVASTVTGSAAKPKSNAVDLDAEGTFNGECIFDLNPDTLEEKPWRKPGADITDYFNYGFTEETWKGYCDRQRRMRSEAGGPIMQAQGLMMMPHRPPFMGHPRGPPPIGYQGHQYMHHGPPGHHLNSSPVSEQSISTVNSLVNENSKYSPSPGMNMMNRNRMMMMVGPPPARRPGAIDVIGTTGGPSQGGPPSRRPQDGVQENFITVLGPRPSGPSIGPSRFGHPHFIPNHPPPVIDAFNQGMPPPMLSNGNYASDFGHDMPPGAPRFSYPPPGHVLGDSPIARRYDEDRGYDQEESPEQDYNYRGERREPSDRYSNDRYDDLRGRSRENTYEDRGRNYNTERHESPVGDRAFKCEEESSREDPSSHRSSESATVKQEDTEETSRSSSRRRSSGHHRSSDRTESSSSSHRDKRDFDSDRSDSKRRHHDNDDSKSSRHKHSKRSRRDKDSH